jgi:hypothetical protein
MHIFVVTVRVPMIVSMCMAMMGMIKCHNANEIDGESCRTYS